METITNKPAELSSRPAAAAAYGLDDWRTVAKHPAMAAMTTATRRVGQGLILFAFSFVEIIAELLAPIVLVFGIGWAMLPNIVSVAGTEGQAKDFIATMAQAIPRDMHFGRTVITPMSLIIDGVLLVAVVALCRTVQTLASAPD